MIHLAGLKSVQEGELYPDKYFYTNVAGTVSLLSALKEYKCSNFIFSSSATVYGKPEYLPYDEEHPTVPVNNYGRTKLSAEQIIQDWSMNNNVSTVSLLSLIHISEPTRRRGISYAVFCLKKKKRKSYAVYCLKKKKIKKKKKNIFFFFFLMIRRPPRSTPLYSSAASDVYKRQT